MKESDLNFTEVVNERDGKTYYDFHDFDKNPVFVGAYLGKYKYEEGDKENHWTALKFRTLKGETFLLATSYQLVEAIKKHGRAVYNILFLRKKDIGKGRTVREFKVSVAPLPDELQAWYEEPETGKSEREIADDLPF